jgi:hypothetical protein
LTVEFAASNRGWRSRAIPLHDEVVGYFSSALFVVLTAVGLLLVIACINIASLLMARASSRTREVAVRAAIGATRQRLVRQFLTESLVLAVVGGVLGVGVAFAAMKAIVVSTPLDIPRLAEVTLDGRALVFAIALVLTTAIVFGLLPALVLSRVDLQRALKEGGRSGSGRGRGAARQKRGATRRRGSRLQPIEYRDRRHSAHRRFLLQLAAGRTVSLGAGTFPPGAARNPCRGCDQHAAARTRLAHSVLDSWCAAASQR